MALEWQSNNVSWCIAYITGFFCNRKNNFCKAVMKCSVPRGPSKAFIPQVVILWIYPNCTNHLQVQYPELTRLLCADHIFNLVTIFLFMKYKILSALLELHHTIDSYWSHCQVKPTMSSTHTIVKWSEPLYGWLFGPGIKTLHLSFYNAS